jgi:type VI protein secretion system component VasF
MKITFFRIPKPKQFQYPPRYYDEEKERREQRRRELGLSGEKPDFRSQISTNWRRINRHDRKRRQTAGISVFVYLLIVAMLIYFIFFT